MIAFIALTAVAFYAVLWGALHLGSKALFRRIGDQRFC